MFNGHTMSVINDLRTLGPEINNVDFLSIASLTGEYPSLPNIYDATILIPPTEMLMAWSDNVPLVLQNEYPKYLMSKEPDDYIVALLAALTKKNIVLYIPMQAFNIFGPILLQHIYYVYGITCNYGPARFCIDITKIPYLISKFYMMDLMDANDYLQAYPAMAVLPQWVINKLANDINPFNGRPASFTEYYDYFNRLNAQKAINQPKKELATLIIKDGAIPK